MVIPADRSLGTIRSSCLDTFRLFARRPRSWRTRIWNSVVITRPFIRSSPRWSTRISCGSRRNGTSKCKRFGKSWTPWPTKVTQRAICDRGAPSGTDSCTKLWNCSTPWVWKHWMRICRTSKSIWSSGTRDRWRFSFELTCLLQREIHSVQTTQCPSSSVQSRGDQGHVLSGDETILSYSTDVQRLHGCLVVGQRLDLSEHHVATQRRYRRVFLHLERVVREAGTRSGTIPRMDGPRPGGYRWISGEEPSGCFRLGEKLSHDQDSRARRWETTKVSESRPSLIASSSSLAKCATIASWWTSIPWN